MEFLSSIWTNYGGFINLFIQGFIAYHVFFLSKSLSSKGKLEHIEKIKAKSEELLNEIRIKKTSSKVYLVNTKRYFVDYPSNKEKIFQGYSHIRADIKGIRFDGIQFFCGMPETVFRQKNGKLSFKGNPEQKVFNVYPVGLVPYEWIDFIDLRGDEFDYSPLFFCHFIGKTNWFFWRRFRFYGFPYKKLLYYKKSENFNKENSHMEMEFQYIDEKIF